MHHQTDRFIVSPCRPCRCWRRRAPPPRGAWPTRPKCPPACASSTPSCARRLVAMAGGGGGGGGLVSWWWVWHRPTKRSDASIPPNNTHNTHNTTIVKRTGVGLGELGVLLEGHEPDDELRHGVQLLVGQRLEQRHHVRGQLRALVQLLGERVSLGGGVVCCRGVDG